MLFLCIESCYLNLRVDIVGEFDFCDEGVYGLVEIDWVFGVECFILVMINIDVVDFYVFDYYGWDVVFLVVYEMGFDYLWLVEKFLIYVNLNEIWIWLILLIEEIEFCFGWCNCEIVKCEIVWCK